MNRDKQPLARVEWVDPATLSANDYNPNHVFGPEMALLRTSLLEDGWTQPIVVRPDGRIVDGFHRYTLAMTDNDVLALGDGSVPVVRLCDKTDAQLMAATVRHNRARGQHGVLAMASITRAIDSDVGQAETQRVLGMDREEYERLVDERGSPERVGKEAFNRGWAPDAEFLAGKRRRHKATVERKRAQKRKNDG